MIVLVGSNLCIAHPIMWERVCRNPHQPEIIVIDPRKTETAMAATQHLAARARSRDLALLYGLAQPADRATAGSTATSSPRTRPASTRSRRTSQRFTPERVAAATGLPAEQHRASSRELIHDGKRVSFWWTMGVNQSHEGVRTAQAIINLALMTGNIGRPGTGANSITGQCNAMGSRLFSNTTNLLGGHDFTDAGAPRQGRRRPRHRRASASRREASLAYDQILEGDPARARSRGCGSSPPTRRTRGSTRPTLRDVLGRLDFLVVQDMYTTTETAAAGATSCCPPPAGARRKARSSTPSGASALIKKVRARARARRSPTSTSSS